MYLLVIFFPIISAFILGFFGRFIGDKGAAIISTTCIFLAFLTSLLIFYEVALLNSVCLIKITP